MPNHLFRPKSLSVSRALRPRLVSSSASVDLPVPERPVIRYFPIFSLDLVADEFVLGGEEVFDQVVDFAVQCGRDVAARVADAVVSNAVSREVISADFLAAVARTN